MNMPLAHPQLTEAASKGSRLYAHKRVFDQMVEGISLETTKIRVGHVLSEGTQMGPLVSSEQLERVSDYLERGASDGAKIVTGGNRIENEGYFIEPTILSDTRPAMAVVREEILVPCSAPCDLMTMSSTTSQKKPIERSTAWRGAYGHVTSVSPIKWYARSWAGTIGVNVHSSIDPAVPFGGFSPVGGMKKVARSLIFIPRSKP